MAKKMGKGGDPLVVQSKVKDYVKKKGCMTSADAIEALNGKVAELLDEAVERTKMNKRATVKAQDI